MVLRKNILILEDNLLVLSKLLDKLYVLEQDQPYDFTLIALTTGQQVQEYVHNNPNASFDVIILDRDDKLNESFHIFEIERFGPEKVIAISSVPEYNAEAKRRGVKRVVLKDFKGLDAFVDSVVKEVERMIAPSRFSFIKFPRR